MRVTMNAMYDSQLAAVNGNYSGLSNAMDHQQYRVLQAGDDPLAAATIVSLNASISELSIYESAAAKVQSAINIMDTNVEHMHTRYMDLDEAMKSIMNADVSEDDLPIYADELHQIEDDLASLLNSQDENGDYIFGGTATGEPPFVKEPVQIDIDGDGTMETVDMYVYKGNGDQKHEKVGETSKLPTTIDGSTIIDDGNGGNIFETIATVTYYLDNGQHVPESEWDKINESMDGISESMISAQTEMGVNLQKAQTNTMLYGNMKQEYQIMLANEQDADIVESITEIQKYQQLINVTSNTTKIMTEMMSISFLD